MTKIILCLAIALSSLPFAPVFAADKPNDQPSKPPLTKPAIKLPLLKDITIRDAQRLIGTVKPLILDLRTPREFNQGHLKGAQNLNFYSSQFTKKLKELDRKKPYLIYCAVGGRSGRTMSAMKKLGFQHVYHMKEGYTLWHSKNLPIVGGRQGLIRR